MLQCLFGWESQEGFNQRRNSKRNEQFLSSNIELFILLAVISLGSVSVHGKKKVQMEQMDKVREALVHLVHRSSLSPSRERWIGRLRRDPYQATEFTGVNGLELTTTTEVEGSLM